MADIHVKPTKRSSSIKKTVRVKKIKVSDKPSRAEDDLIGDEDEEVDQCETDCLLRSALNIKKTCNEQEEDEQENNVVIDNCLPVDQLINDDNHKNDFNNEKKSSLIQEDIQDYVVIGCRFPNGVVICLDNNKMLLRGINDMPDQDSISHYQNVGFTKITRLLWKEFLKTHKHWPPLLNGFVFVADKNII